MSAVSTCVCLLLDSSDAELIAFGICKNGPMETGYVVIGEPRTSELLDLGDQRFRVLVVEVEMQAILCGLVLGYLLEREPDVVAG